MDSNDTPITYMCLHVEAYQRPKLKVSMGVFIITNLLHRK
jgi:hypothetical protein